MSGLSPIEPVLLARLGKPDSAMIETYLADGGYASWKKVLGGAKSGEWTPAKVTDLVKASGLRGRGRRGLSVRHEVDVRAAEGEAGRQARLPPLQRGRVRARHVQGPAPDGDRPAPGARRDDARELRPGREARLPLHPRRDGARGRDPEQGRRRGLREGLPRKGRSRVRAGARLSRSTAARAPTSAARRRRSSRASRASAAIRASSRRFRPSPAPGAAPPS